MIVHCSRAIRASIRAHNYEELLKWVTNNFNEKNSPVIDIEKDFDSRIYRLTIYQNKSNDEPFPEITEEFKRLPHLLNRLKEFVEDYKKNRNHI